MCLRLQTLSPYERHSESRVLVGERTGGRWRLGRAAARVVCEALVPSEYQLLLEGCSPRAELRLVALKPTCEASELSFTLWLCNSRHTMPVFQETHS